MNNDKLKAEVLNETPSENSAILSNQWNQRDYEISASQELKIINLILKSIKIPDLDVNFILQTLMDSEVPIYLKLLNDRIESLSQNTLIEIRNLINDLKIYFVTVPSNEPVIRPWSVVGRYVRKCVIIYEKMSFEKLNTLCKQALIQFKHLSLVIAKNRQNNSANKPTNPNNNNNNNNTNNAKNLENQAFDNQMEQAYEIDNSSSPTSGDYFLNETNLTVTSDYLNRSANADYSGMDLDDSLSHSNLININVSNIGNPSNASFANPLNKFHSQRMFNPKALTSTVSAQRTQSMSNFKTKPNAVHHHLNNEAVVNEKPNLNKTKHHPTVTFSLKNPKLSNLREINETSINNNDFNTMPPPPSLPPLSSIGSATTSAMPYAFSLTNGCAFSRKIAEYFVAQQANLIENNDHDALSPVELQLKIDELLAYDSNFADAYYLKYLNHLRLRDYPSALKSLHDYFDRVIFAGSVSLAALNLCSLEYRFDHRENSLFALKEAITSAHHEGDNACLQHCLSWLYKMDPMSGGRNLQRRNFLIKSACSRAINNEIYNLASYNLHYFARNNIGKHQPETILNLLNKTDIINLKMESRVELSLLSNCHKAALWNLYGHRKLCNLHSQLLLNLLPKSNLNKLNTESQCIAMCNLSLEFCRNGQYNASQSLIDLCKELYSIYTKTSEHWMYAENLILIEKNMLSGKWNLCHLHIEKLATINYQQAILQEMNVYILEGNIDKAKEIGKKIQSNLKSANSNQNTTLSNNNNNTQFDFFVEQLNINLRFNYIQISVALKEYSNALIAAIKFFHEVKQLNFNYELMISCLLIAKILIYMEYPEQAIKYLEKCMVFILSNGSLVDQAKLHFLYAKCLHLLDKTKNLDTCVFHMNKCVEKLESVQGSIFLISAYAFLSLLLNETGNFIERNKYAFKFRQLRQQHPLVGFLL